MGLVIFSHGKESGPVGTKIKLLSGVVERMGHRYISVDYRSCTDVFQRVGLLRTILARNLDEKIVLVGSSMGGYVSTVVSEEYKIHGLFLMCPALFMIGDEEGSYMPKTSNIALVHGWKDDIVPYRNSVKFGGQTSASLYLIDDDHRLCKSLDFLEFLFTRFIDKTHF